MKVAFNEKKLKKIIDSKEIISFDIFDTLIKRNCKKPTDIFEIVENRYNNNNENKIENFKEKRIKAEIDARKESKYEDINLDEIYKMIEYDEKISEILKKIEIETELDYCQKNYSIYKIYEYCKTKKKKIICISDMYLDKENISKILNKNDYNIEDIFISSEIRKTKLTGSIFEHVITELKINKQKMLHIGDSYKADLIAPLKKKIKSFHIQKYEKNTIFLRLEKKENIDISTNIMVTMINNNVKKYDDYYEKIGYEILGPICCSFALWVNDIAKKEKITNLLFCARDMELVQKIYNQFYEDEPIKNSYFYISRKSTYLPYLYVNQDYKNFQELIPVGKRKLCINELLDLYNIKIDKNINKYNFKNDKKYDLDTFRYSNDFKLYYSEQILKYIKVKGKEQYEFFTKYLQNLHLDSNTAIIDLGWRGTTQKIMIDIVKHNINGLYLGLHTKNEKYLKNNYWTYLFDGKENDYSNKIYSFMALVELLFSALHGSTIAYNNNDKQPYILNKSANENNKYILNIQNGAIKFFEDITKYKKDLKHSDNILFINELIKIGTEPTLKQVNVLGNIYTENLKVRALAKPKSLCHYLFHIKELKEDLLDSEWKIGFMKKLFKIKLPYYKIYLLLKKEK